MLKDYRDQPDSAKNLDSSSISRRAYALLQSISDMKAPDIDARYKI